MTNHPNRSRLPECVEALIRYPSLRCYVQGDPRGPALYILRPGDVSGGAGARSFYTRGIAVYK